MRRKNRQESIPPLAEPEQRSWNNKWEPGIEQSIGANFKRGRLEQGIRMPVTQRAKTFQ
jgi:hypothetical protein